jgi:hypothetical protein
MLFAKPTMVIAITAENAIFPTRDMGRDLMKYTGGQCWGRHNRVSMGCCWPSRGEYKMIRNDGIGRSYLYVSPVFHISPAAMVKTNSRRMQENQKDKNNDNEKMSVMTSPMSMRQIEMDWMCQC